MKPTRKLIVIGGGAAGFFCAVNAALLSPQLEVTIVEKTAKLLSKVKISGGGRCNVTNACFAVADLVKKYPRGTQFLKKAFQQFNTNDTVSWFEQRGVSLKTEADGRMFPSTNVSQTIIDCLLAEASRLKVFIRMNAAVTGITKESEAFTLSLYNGSTLQADYVVIASGGFPKEQMFDWIKNTAHTVQPPVPSLFTFNIPKHKIVSLMGLSVAHATVKINGTKLKETGAVLITHWGLSGPAILRLSAWGARELSNKNWQFEISVNWLNDVKEEALRDIFLQQRTQHGGQMLAGKNIFGLPQRLWEFLVAEAGAEQPTRWADLSAKVQNKLIKNLCAYELSVSGKTTYKDEFVTAGGVTLGEVDANTCMSRIVPNLYFAGEILDIDGITGGFNFQNAWTTGFIAAKAIAAAALAPTDYL
ncbi:MAG: NAD(P)/FAD-dependent oxidoreductase [Edaphocola sp.]